jgi:hypothetical protein
MRPSHVVSTGRSCFPGLSVWYAGGSAGGSQLLSPPTGSKWGGILVLYATWHPPPRGHSYNSPGIECAPGCGPGRASAAPAGPPERAAAVLAPGPRPPPPLGSGAGPPGAAHRARRNTHKIVQIRSSVAPGLQEGNRGPVGSPLGLVASPC